jgi:hypothetical protein
MGRPRLSFLAMMNDGVTDSLSLSELCVVPDGRLTMGLAPATIEGADENSFYTLHRR